MIHDSAVPQDDAVIHDIRYTRFSGSLRPRWTAVAALARSGVQRALGIRRTAGAKVWPFLLVAAATAPALVAVGVPLLVAELALAGIEGPLDVLSYGDLLASTGVIVLAFAATTLPSLLTRERRDRVLSLYFSTAVSPLEYVVGKVLAAVALVLVVTLGPMLVLLVGGILTADAPLQYAADSAGDWPRVVAAGLLVACYHAAIALALGSLTDRRVLAVGGYLALMLVPAGIGAVLYALSERTEFLAMVLLYVPIDLARALLGADPVPGSPSAPPGVLAAVWVGAVVLGLTTLVLRYLRGNR